MGQFYFGDNVDKWVNFKLALTHLKQTLIDEWEQVNRNQQEAQLSTKLFARLASITLIDKYQAYQLLSDRWKVISTDLEMMQTEGINVTRHVEPNMVIKKKDGKETEVQDGWKGRIMPFDLVQNTYLKDEVQYLKEKKGKLSEMSARLDSFVETVKEENDNSPLLNDKNNGFVKGELTKAIKDIYDDIDSEEITLLNQYIALLGNKPTKLEKVSFTEAHPQVHWKNIEPNKDGTYGKGKVNAYLQTLKEEFIFDPESMEGKLIEANQLLDEQSALKTYIKEKAELLDKKTRTIIGSLTDNQIKNLLALKWITPLCDDLAEMPGEVVNYLTRQVQKLADKYAVTYSQIANDIETSEQELAGIMGQLTGNEPDMQGIAELTSLLKGKDDEC
ncbi:hypothetical protein [Salinivibrio kushneri]|uniref:hypothetical protein n=1 Tax=Salinivibrio kushneri TaxID=1908198 RepID=UPI0022B42B72|nr:hypothetical protein [Salinivibrio kushneri]WBA18058.1 hypothetical protein O4598_00730 [Salinivibrio kushneri]